MVAYTYKCYLVLDIVLGFSTPDINSFNHHSTMKSIYGLILCYRCGVKIDDDEDNDHDNSDDGTDMPHKSNCSWGAMSNPQ